ncbi:hypothetical protein LCGC14_0709360 [marine sediment metagenome]|uniref:Uncharacterized protein n=1 Tax=marine sediment metagenome TaxID=412755 RepID=A0A0F9QK34_9ZZZZ
MTSTFLAKAETAAPVIVPDAPRGTYITPDELEAVLGVLRSSTDYAFQLMRMMEAFRADSMAAGDPKLISSRKNGLAILTDAEAADHTVKQAAAGLKKTQRAIMRGVASVRPSHLEEVRRRRWERETTNMSRVLQGTRELESTLFLREITDKSSG